MKTTLITVITALAALISSCNQSPSNNGGTLDAAAFDRMVKDSNDEIVLDVRTPDEFAQGHISGAVLMDVNNSDFNEKISTLDKSKTIFVYCASGVRSKKAAAILKDSGFERIYYLENGLKSWTKAGKELAK